VTPGPSRVTLSWTAPASDGGSPVTGYRVYAGPVAGPIGDGADGTMIGAVTGTGAVVTGLAIGTTYWIRVAAVNAAGQGPRSAAVLVAVTSAEPGPVGSSASATPRPFAAPTQLIAVAGPSRITLSWTAPASTGGSPVTGYKLYWATASGSPSGAAVTSVSGTSATVASLTSGVIYYFWVAAVDAAGRESPLSAEVSARPGPAAPMTLTNEPVPHQLVTALAAVAVVAFAGALALVIVARRADSREGRRQASLAVRRRPGPQPSARQMAGSRGGNRNNR
jgi:titin